MDILIAGNTGYFNEETITAAFGKNRVVVSDYVHKNKRSGNITWFDKSVMTGEFEELFTTYSFEKVFYVSCYVTKDSNELGEIEELRRVISLAKNAGIRDFVYIASDNAIRTDDNSFSIIYSSAVDICEYYAKSHGMDIKVVYSPYLIAGFNREDYWNRILRKLDNKESVKINAKKNDHAHFLSMQDLASFIKNLLEVWEFKGKSKVGSTEKIILESGAKTTYGRICKEILKEYPDADIKFTGSEIRRRKMSGTEAARNKYGWFPHFDACADFGDYIESYKLNFSSRPGLLLRIRQRLRKGGNLLTAFELVGGAALVEFFNSFNKSSIQFRMIDVRLLFIVLMSSVYGTTIGLVTAAVQIVSLVIAYSRQGTNPLLIFYDPGNWVPFILMLVVAAMCGYQKQKRDEEAGFIKLENESLRNENNFVTQLYQEAMEYKNQYKQNLIGSRDGFGRIFDVVQKLNATLPEEIFAKSIPIMEDILANDSIAIYTIHDANSKFARLNVASEKIGNNLRKSIYLEDYRDVIKSIREKEIWFNNSVTEGYPTYVSGIMADGEMAVLIMVYDVDYVQIGTYYTNLIRILTGLVGNSFIRALEYQRVIADENYLDGTIIAKPDYFLQQLNVRKEAAENGRSTFRLIKVENDGKDLQQLDEMFQANVRNNDLAGLGSDDNIYIIATQVDETNEESVLKRFSDMGLTCSVVGSVA